MLKYLATIVVISLTVTKTIAISDSLTFITYKSDFEKKVFDSLSVAQPLDLLLAISGDMNDLKANKIKSSIEQYALELAKNKAKTSNQVKKVQKIFKLTHAEYLSKYTEISNFNKIFTISEYNCVSATALYSLIFEEMNIPFQIKMAPTHVYSVAYPGTKDIIVESTAPKSGYYYPTDNDISASIKELISLKYISQEEVDSLGSRKVYNNFFFEVEDINLRELASLQYYNEAISHINNQDFDNALNSSLKCQKIYPSDKNDFLVLSILNYKVTGLTFTKLDEMKYIALYCQQAKVEKNTFSELYQLSIKNSLFVDNNKKLFDKSYAYLRNRIKDSALIHELNRIYYVSCAEYYYRTSRVNKTLKYADTAYQYDTSSFFLQQVIAESIVRRLSTDQAYFHSINGLKSLENQYPFLLENSLFQSMRLSMHAAKAYEAFRDKKMDQGLYELDSIEFIFSRFTEDLILVETTIVEAYGKGGMAFYKKNNPKKGLEIIERGLAMYPYSEYLYERLNYLNKELGIESKSVPSRNRAMKKKEEEAFQNFLRARDARH